MNEQANDDQTAANLKELYRRLCAFSVAESTPAESASAENSPAENVPAENSPAENVPAENATAILRRIAASDEGLEALLDFACETIDRGDTDGECPQYTASDPSDEEYLTPSESEESDSSDPPLSDDDGDDEDDDEDDDEVLEHLCKFFGLGPERLIGLYGGGEPGSGPRLITIDELRQELRETKAAGEADESDGADESDESDESDETGETDEPGETDETGDEAEYALEMLDDARSEFDYLVGESDKRLSGYPPEMFVRYPAPHEHSWPTGVPSEAELQAADDAIEKVAAELEDEDAELESLRNLHRDYMGGRHASGIPLDDPRLEGGDYGAELAENILLRGDHSCEDGNIVNYLWEGLAAIEAMASAPSEPAPGPEPEPGQPPLKRRLEPGHPAPEPGQPPLKRHRRKRHPQRQTPDEVHALRRLEYQTLDEIRASQRGTAPIIDKQAFSLLVREIVQDHCLSEYLSDVELSPGAVESLQVAAEDYLIGLLADANLSAIHAGRTYVHPKDLLFVSHIRARGGL